MKDYLSCFFVLFILLSCSNKFEEGSTLEQQVYQDIFPELVDKTFQDFRKLPVPPLAPYSPNATSNEHTKKYKDKEEMDEAFSQAVENHKIYLDTTDFAPLTVIVSDTVAKYSKKDKLISRHNNINFDTEYIKSSFKIDVSKIEMPVGYDLKYKSAFSESIEELKKADWEKYPNKEQRHLHKFSGELNLYQIYFNEETTYGFLHVGFYCGKLCGCSYRVFVKKINKKWVIDDIQNLGCA